MYVKGYTYSLKAAAKRVWLQTFPVLACNRGWQTSEKQDRQEILQMALWAIQSLLKLLCLFVAQRPSQAIPKQMGMAVFQLSDYLQKQGVGHIWPAGHSLLTPDQKDPWNSCCQRIICLAYTQQSLIKMYTQAVNQTVKGGIVCSLTLYLIVLKKLYYHAFDIPDQEPKVNHL